MRRPRASGSRGAEQSPIRIVHVVSHLDTGGLERLVVDIVRALSGPHFDFRVVCLSYVGRQERDIRGYADVETGPSQEFYSMLWPRRLSRFLRDMEPDIVHTHSGVWYKGSLAARMADAGSIVHTEHGRQHPDPWHARWLDSIAARRTDRVVAVSQSTADQLDQYVVPDHSRPCVIRNGVDTERFEPGEKEAARRKLGLPTGRVILGSVGRFSDVKGYEVMLEAFGHFLGLWDGPGRPLLLLAGEGEQGEDLRGYVRGQDWSDDVRFLGWVENVLPLLQSIDLFTLSSWSEGMSVSLLEAMSAGVPPVVTDVGGNASVLGTELKDFLVPAGDPLALARNWRRVLRSPAAAEEAGRIARRRVERHYSLRSMTDRYRRLYTDLHGRPS